MADSERRRVQASYTSTTQSRRFHWARSHSMDIKGRLSKRLRWELKPPVGSEVSEISYKEDAKPQWSSLSWRSPCRGPLGGRHGKVLSVHSGRLEGPVFPQCSVEAPQMLTGHLLAAVLATGMLDPCPTQGPASSGCPSIPALSGSASKGSGAGAGSRNPTHWETTSGEGGSCMSTKWLVIYASGF